MWIHGGEALGAVQEAGYLGKAAVFGLSQFYTGLGIPAPPPLKASNFLQGQSYCSSNISPFPSLLSHSSQLPYFQSITGPLVSSLYFTSECMAWQ